MITVSVVVTVHGGGQSVRHIISGNPKPGENNIQAVRRLARSAAAFAIDVQIKEPVFGPAETPEVKT